MSAQAQEIDLFQGWECEPHQDDFWRFMEAGGRRAAVVWHRRAGKDDVSLHWTCASMLETVGNYWHMLPQAEQARKAIWEAVNKHTGRRRIDECFPVELRRRTRSNEMMIEFKNGSTWQVVGSDNFNALVGSSPVGIVFSEWSLADPACWAYLRPILRENGGWAIFIYTPRGRNHGLSLFESAKRAQGWFCEIKDATQTGVFTPEELEEERLEQIATFGEELGQAYFEQEYLCSFDAAVLGAVYAAAIRKREVAGAICSLLHDPDYPVYTAWDFGFSDATSIWWFQILPGPRLHVIDHYRNTGQDITHYCERIHGREIVASPTGLQLGAPIPQHAHRQAYEYEKHYVPHDGANKTLAAGGRSIGDQAFALNVKMTVVPKTTSVNNIGAARKTLEVSWFDQDRCARGLEALRSYHYALDEKKRVLGDEPVHDWCLTGDTEIVTRYATYRIMDLPQEGEVMTSCGWKRYTAPRITRRNAPLVEVRFSDGLTVRCTPEHKFKTASGWTLSRLLQPGTLIQSCSMPSRNTSTAASIECGPAKVTSLVAAENSIATLGSWLSALFQKGITSTIEIGIRSIIAWITSNASIRSLMPNTGCDRPLSLAPRVKQRPTGTAVTRDGFGTAEWLNAAAHGQSGSEKRGAANFASASMSSLSAKTGISSSTAHRNAEWRTIESVVELRERSDVWCITVPGLEEFALSNGALVHNSSHDADAYEIIAQVWQVPREAKPPERPRFLHEATADEIFWSKDTGIAPRQGRI